MDMTNRIHTGISDGLGDTVEHTNTLLLSTVAGASDAVTSLLGG